MLFAVVVVAAIQEHNDVSVCTGSDPNEAVAPTSACPGKASAWNADDAHYIGIHYSVLPPPHHCLLFLHPPLSFSLTHITINHPQSSLLFLPTSSSLTGVYHVFWLDVELFP